MENCTSGTQSTGRRSSGKLFFKLPPAALTFQALISPAGKGRSRSIGSWMAPQDRRKLSILASTDEV